VDRRRFKLFTEDMVRSPSLTSPNKYVKTRVINLQYALKRQLCKGVTLFMLFCQKDQSAIGGNSDAEIGSGDYRLNDPKGPRFSDCI